MNKLPLFFVVSVLGAGALSSACSSKSTASPATTGDAGKDATVLDGSGGDGAGGGDVQAEAAPPAPSFNLRFAQWSPDGAQVDFCIAAHGSGSFSGPVLSAAGGVVPDAGADGGPAELTFPSVTNYVSLSDTNGNPLPPAQYDVRVVAAGGDCSKGLASDATTIPAFANGGYYTVATIGDTTPAASDPSLTLVSFVDDASPPAAGIGIRFINATPSIPSLSFGTGKFGSGFQPYFKGVAFGKAGSTLATDAGTLDTADYLGLASVTVPLSMETATGATGDTAVVHTLAAQSNAVLTFVAVGAKTGSTAAQILLCVDNTAGPNGLLGSCSIVSK